MKGSAAVTNRCWIGFICCALLPLAAMGGGIVLLVHNTVFHRGIAVTFFLIPLIAIGLLALSIFHRGGTGRKVLLSSAILIVFVLVFIPAFFFTALVRVNHYDGTDAEQQYRAAAMENPLMPKLTDIGQPADISYHHISSVQLIFSSETDYLICRYTPEAYEVQKAALDEKYAFQTEVIRNHHADCAPSAEVDSYLFRVLSMDEYSEDLHFPKDLVLIGTSDDVREVVYLAFRDVDIDYIPSLETFITDTCYWKYIP